MLHIGVTFFVAFGATLLLTPLVRAGARAVGQVAAPSKDRWHSRPTALMGGIAMYSGFITGVLGLLGWAGPPGSSPWLLAGLAGPGLGIVVGASIMFATGVVDDVVHLRPTSKLVLQALAAAALITLGVRLSITPWVHVNIILTLFWFIAVTNAVNLLDNMDGVASGVTGVGALSLAVLFALRGEWLLAGLSAALAGATAGFLPYNFRPASIFMGDSGSLFLGALLAGIGAAYSEILPGARPSLAALAVPLLIVLVPVFDTCLVTVTRTLARYSIAQGGRDHVAHRLVGMGFSERTVALLLYALAACGGAFALLISRDVGGGGAWFSVIFVGLLAIVGVYLSHLYSYPPEGARPLSRSHVLLEEVLYKRRLLEVLADLVVFSLAYSGAYLLRYDAPVPVSQAAVMAHTLALAVASKSVAFWITGVYRGAWHQISIPDVHRLIRATLLGMVLTVVAIVFTFREAEFSRSIFALDALLTLLFAAGARVSFRSLDRVQYRLSGVGARSLIYGAGRGGELLLREISSNRELGLHPVGLLDDDPGKQRRAIYGIPVLGGIEEFQNIVKDRSINKVVIATKKISQARSEQVSEFCRTFGIDLLRLELELRPVGHTSDRVQQNTPSLDTREERVGHSNGGGLRNVRKTTSDRAVPRIG